MSQDADQQRQVENDRIVRRRELEVLRIHGSAEHIYVPEDRDDLRDGLFRGFHAHRKARLP